MKSLIRICCLTVFALLITGTIYAQRGHHNPEQRIEKMTEELGLSEAQVTKVEAIFAKYEDRIKAVRDQDGERSEKRSAMKKIRKDIKAEVKLVLTKEQADKAETLMAQRPDRGDRFKDRSDRRKKHQARKALHKQKVAPILLKQRAKLESKISQEDKATIADLRVKFEAKKAARKKDFKKGERPDREEMKRQHEARKNSPDHQAIKALVEKYQADIESLMAEVKPEIEKIKKEMKDGKERKKGKGKKGGKKRRGAKENGEKGAHKGKHKMKNQAHFLLLDPSKVATSNVSPQSSISNVSVYPNPSQGVSQIKYDLKTDGNVLIELRDKAGNLIETIEQSDKVAGTYKTPVNFGKYTVGIYYVVLKDMNGNSETVKVVR